MAYIALYRKYRPTTFDKLIGQEHIVKVLKNQIAENRIGHAYLFCGTRGTGKTSAAKIFAKAINCLTPKDSSPCGVCASCLALKDINNMDVIEIDAASNNKVEEIREIREKVQYPPVAVKYKVYIIDEVHMLTESAFNALLKTLEEPPVHAVFVLATTEPHKLPQTILSRCMRFDFKLVSDEKIENMIENIFNEMEYKYEKQAISLIAKMGEGSVRDALSIADKCICSKDEMLTYQNVVNIVGGADKNQVFQLAIKILTGDSGGILNLINDMIKGGTAVNIICKELAGIFHDLAVVRTATNANGILKLPENKFMQYVEFASGCELKIITDATEKFLQIENELRFSSNPRIVLETTALKCAKASNDLTVDGLFKRVNVIEKKLDEIAKTKQQNEILQGANSQFQKKKLMNETQSSVVISEEEKKNSGRAKRIVKTDYKLAWSEFVGEVRKDSNEVIKNLIKHATGSFSGNMLTITVKNAVSLNFLKREDVKKQILHIFNKLGYDVQVSEKLDEQSNTVGVEYDYDIGDEEQLKDVLSTDNLFKIN